MKNLIMKSLTMRNIAVLFLLLVLLFSVFFLFIPLASSVDAVSTDPGKIIKDVAVDNKNPEYLKALTSSLGHLKGTPPPGDRGNSVVFGHSAPSLSL